MLNHGLFKGLLFLNAGSVIQATGTRDLEQMGGLSRTMPVTSGTFLVGAWAICGLPPLNGFVSEWLIYLAAFQGLALSRLPWTVIALSALALIGALALACFAKAYGTVFLGQPRSAEAAAGPRIAPRHAGPHAPAGGPLRLHRPGAGAAGARPGPPGRQRLRRAGPAQPWRASRTWPACRPWPLFLLGSPPSAGAGPSPARPAGDLPTWDCGYLAGSPRMQYTASSFADGLVSGMRFVLWPQVHFRRIAAFFPAPRRFHSHVPDPVLDRAGAPGLDLAARGLRACCASCRADSCPSTCSMS